MEGVFQLRAKSKTWESLGNTDAIVQPYGSTGILLPGDIGWTWTGDMEVTGFLCPDLSTPPQEFTVIYIMFVIAVPVSSAKKFLRQGQLDRTVNIWIAFFFFVQSIFWFSVKMFTIGLDYQTATDAITSDDLGFIYTHPIGSDGQCCFWQSSPTSS